MKERDSHWTYWLGSSFITFLGILHPLIALVGLLTLRVNRERIAVQVLMVTYLHLVCAGTISYILISPGPKYGWLLYLGNNLGVVALLWVLTLVVTFLWFAKLCQFSWKSMLQSWEKTLDFLGDD